MGSGGIQLGLVLYERLEDLEGIFVEQAENALERLEGKVISLAFDPGSELPRPMRREVAAAGWEVAAADSYPYLMTINTPAGGVTKADAADLLAALEAVPAFLEAHGEEIEAGASPLAFEHAATGTEVRADWGEMGRVARVWLEAVPLTAGTLAPGDAQGAGARPEAALDSDFDDAGLERLAEAELEVVDSYERALAGEGLSASTIRRHVETARRFVEFLAWSQGIPLAAIHEYDLREYLYDWFPRKEMTSETQAKAARGSLRRFLRYLSAGQEISLPRAWDLLGKKEAFEARCAGAPAGAWWDSDVQEWRETHYLSLQLDLLVHDPTLAGGEPWGAFMGPVEARLDRELQRRWLLWRDDQLRRRADPDPDDLLRHLTERQRAWETTPQAKLAGKSPAEAIAAERREHQERLRDGPPREV
jgi:hypothetical protein